MTKESDGLKMTNENSDALSYENQKDSQQSEEMTRFRKQQDINLQMKEVMSKELNTMELPEYIVNEILNLEDEIPF